MWRLIQENMAPYSGKCGIGDSGKDRVTEEMVLMVPDENQRAQWMQDYERTRENMIFGDAPDFATIIAAIKILSSSKYTTSSPQPPTPNTNGVTALL